MNLNIYVILVSTDLLLFERIKTVPALVFSDVCEEDYGLRRCDAL
jgi:hypothetical protein